MKNKKKWKAMGVVGNDVGEKGPEEVQYFRHCSCSRTIQSVVALINKFFLTIIQVRVIKELITVLCLHDQNTATLQHQNKLNEFIGNVRGASSK